jgi:hypothetical protein
VQATYDRNATKTLLTGIPAEDPALGHDSLNSSRDSHLPVPPKMKLLTSHVPSAKALNSVPVHAVEVCGGVKVQLHAFLTSALDKGEW